MDSDNEGGVECQQLASRELKVSAEEISRWIVGGSRTTGAQRLKRRLLCFPNESNKDVHSFEDTAKESLPEAEHYVAELGCCD